MTTHNNSTGGTTPNDADSNEPLSVKGSVISEGEYAQMAALEGFANDLAITQAAVELFDNLIPEHKGLLNCRQIPRAI